MLHFTTVHSCRFYSSYEQNGSHRLQLRTQVAAILFSRFHTDAIARVANGAHSRLIGIRIQAQLVKGSEVEAASTQHTATIEEHNCFY